MLKRKLKINYPQNEDEKITDERFHPRNAAEGRTKPPKLQPDVRIIRSTKWTALPSFAKSVIFPSWPEGGETCVG